MADELDGFDFVDAGFDEEGEGENEEFPEVEPEQEPEPEPKPAKAAKKTAGKKASKKAPAKRKAAAAPKKAAKKKAAPKRTRQKLPVEPFGGDTKLQKLGAAVKATMQALGVTQEELSKKVPNERHTRIGVDGSYVSMCIKGWRYRDKEAFRPSKSAAQFLAQWVKDNAGKVKEAKPTAKPKAAKKKAAKKKAVPAKPKTANKSAKKKAAPKKKAAKRTRK